MKQLPGGGASIVLAYGFQSAGMFAAPHKRSSDRLIFDRRPQNATERRCKWVDLPHGTLLCRIRLKPDEHVTGTGDDLKNFFYNLSTPLEWRKRTAFGRVFSGAEAAELGGSPHKRYHMCLSVWPMGDLNAVDITQATHEAVLSPEP